MNPDSFGYALGMEVLQSELYHRLDDRARAECDELIARVHGAEYTLYDTQVAYQNGRRSSLNEIALLSHRVTIAEQLLQDHFGPDWTLDEYIRCDVAERKVKA